MGMTPSGRSHRYLGEVRGEKIAGQTEVGGNGANQSID